MNTLAQLANENQAALTVYGPMGIMLAWFMWRGEKVAGKLADLAHRIDGLTKALLLEMIDRDSLGAGTQKYIHETIAKIDARAAKEKEK